MDIYYYKSEKDFIKIHHGLKQRKCPHCSIIGTLILHGYLKGYKPDCINTYCVRGHRIFCSNRGKRRGCGKTFSIMLSLFIKKFMFCTRQIANLFKMIFNKSQDNIYDTGNMSVSSRYRIKKLLSINQHTIREKLLKKENPPFCNTDEPLVKTLYHLSAVFPDNKNPVQAFQQHFQKSFFTDGLPKYGILR